ncbi:MAG TPA: DUF1877 family protein [Syntrophomonadaceae bacterium]|nr:DUF1877 family protein [Syntrophomonadaceae bacterium]
MSGKYTRLSQQEIGKLMDNPDGAEQILLDHDREILKIQKAWQDLQLLLTADLWNASQDLSFAVLGGHPLGNLRVGWTDGPPLYQTPEEVKLHCEIFRGISLDDIRQECQRIRIWGIKIDPGTWDHGDQELEQLLKQLKAIMDFFQEAASNGEGMIFWID